MPWFPWFSFFLKQKRDNAPGFMTKEQSERYHPCIFGRIRFLMLTDHRQIHTTNTNSLLMEVWG